MAESMHFATTVKRWVFGLAAACLLAGGYALLAKSGEEPSRAGQIPGPTRAMPVQVAAAHWRYRHLSQRARLGRTLEHR